MPTVLIKFHWTSEVARQAVQGAPWSCALGTDESTTIADPIDTVTLLKARYLDF